MNGLMETFKMLKGTPRKEAEQTFESAHKELMSTLHDADKREAERRATKALGNLGAMLRNGGQTNGVG